MDQGYNTPPVGADHCSMNSSMGMRTSGELTFDHIENNSGIGIGEGRYKNNILAFAPTLAMYDYCFEQFNTQHFKARVKATNSAAIHYNQKLGYKTIRTEEQGSVLEMLLTYNDYQSSTKMLKQFLSRSSKK